MAVLKRDLDNYQRALDTYSRDANKYNNQARELNASYAADLNGNRLVLGPDGNISSVGEDGRLVAAQLPDGVGYGSEANPNGYDPSRFVEQVLPDNSSYRALRVLGRQGVQEPAALNRVTPTAPTFTQAQGRSVGSASMVDIERGLVSEALRGKGVRGGVPVYGRNVTPALPVAGAVTLSPYAPVPVNTGDTGGGLIGTLMEQQDPSNVAVSNAGTFAASNGTAAGVTVGGPIGPADISTTDLGTLDGGTLGNTGNTSSDTGVGNPGESAAESSQGNTSSDTGVGNPGESAAESSQGNTSSDTGVGNPGESASESSSDSSDSSSSDSGGGDSGGGDSGGGDSGGGGGGGGGGGSDGGADGGGGGWAKGGLVTKDRLVGPDPRGPDEGYGALKSGEFVLTAEAVKKLGPSGLDALRRLNQDSKKSGKTRALIKGAQTGSAKQTVQRVSMERGLITKARKKGVR